MNNINYDAVVNHIAGKGQNEFEIRRNRAEYDKMLKVVHEIAKEPVYRWPEESDRPNK